MTIFLLWKNAILLIHVYEELHLQLFGEPPKLFQDLTALVCAQLGLNALADMSHEEFKSQSFGYRPDLRNGSELQQTPFKYVDAVAPKSVDWHAKGAVTKVKNQAQVQYLH